MDNSRKSRHIGLIMWKINNGHLTELKFEFEIHIFVPAKMDDRSKRGNLKAGNGHFIGFQFFATLAKNRDKLAKTAIGTSLQLYPTFEEKIYSTKYSPKDLN